MAIESAVQPAGGFASLWRVDGFRRLALGQAVSGIGDWMATLALMVLVHDISDSSAAVGGVLVLRLMPSIIAGPIAAKVVRRWDRRSTMLSMDAVRVAIVLAIPIIDALWWIYICAFLLELAGLLFLPARDSAVPDLAPGASMPLANGLMLAASFGTIPFGALLFGIVSWLGGGGAPAAVFIIDAATFVVSYAFIARIALVDRRDWDAGESEPQFRGALRIPLVRSVGPAALITALGLGTLFSMGIVFVQEVLEASTFDFGVLVALFGAGAAVGLAALHLKGKADIGTARFCVFAQGVVVATMSQLPTIVMAFAGALLFGAATAAGLTTAMSILQEQLADRERLLAFTVFHVLIRAGLGLAALGAGLAGDFLGRLSWPFFGTLPPARAVLLCAGALVAMCSVFVRLPREQQPTATDAA